jgi:hypothetical protein
LALLYFRRQLFTTRILFATSKKTKEKPAAMSGSNTPTKASRRRSASSENETAQPPSKKPMFSIFQKGTGTPTAPADIDWKTHGTSFIVGEAFNPKAGSKVAAFDLVGT